MDIQKAGKIVGGVIADKLKFKGFLEAIDDPAFKLVFGQLFKLIPEKYQDEAIALAEVVKDGQISEEECERLFDILVDNIKKKLNEA